MSNYIKATGLSFFLAALCWVLAIVIITPATAKVWLGIFAIAFSIVFLCLLVVSIGKKIKPTVSPYRMFALADGILGVCVSAYALYDFATDTGWFAGLTGMLLLMFVLPINIVLLIADFLVWKVKTTKTKA